MSSSPLKVAIVGTGLFATATHLPTLQKLENVVPYSCYNRTKSKAEEFASKAGITKVYDSLEEVFQDKEVDVVDVLLPVQYNVEAVKLAVKYNKPICLEKPIAANLEQAKEIVQLDESSPTLPISILENWSYMNAIDILKNEVLPKIGDVISFTYRSTGAWNENNKYLTTSWRQNPQHIGGFLSDGGVHQLALLTGVLGAVDLISALTKQVRKASGDDDIVYSTVKMSSGVIGTFTYGSAFGATDKSSTFLIMGTNGSIEFDFSPSLPKKIIKYQTGDSAQAASAKQIIEVDSNDTSAAEFSNFFEAVAQKDKSLILTKPRLAYHHLSIVGAALESVKSGSFATVSSPVSSQ
ncbi:uncharacterized protein KQ657_004708 [Scheffersomyces spartinae]|uniref:Uncharacterized protein n=1 Tax=Scheffersomyces spartinae TaxID=45513 RepID=A0A9P7VB14_9ASCO|nr:uncharacterized protein KQ657_004708 [Scheffersomyces spartinae]KAG7194493.1 hypothetical protein KQ657_004708 [Scheffersomyces spartinae]